MADQDKFNKDDELLNQLSETENGMFLKEIFKEIDLTIENLNIARQELEPMQEGQLVCGKEGNVTFAIDQTAVEPLLTVTFVDSKGATLVGSIEMKKKTKT